MVERKHHLAEINVARMRAPLTDPMMAGFVAQLEAVNASADAAPGFVWRLQTSDGDATALRVFAEDDILVNLSVWETLEDLFAFTYKGGHVGAYRARGDWFHRPTEAVLALWWIAAGELPTVEDAKARLDHLRAHGPSPHAFTFKSRFPPEAEGI
jgi:hypothetical protein